MRNLSFLFVLSLAAAMGALPLFAQSSKKQVEVIATADSEDDGYEAYRALDGDWRTMWHTQFRGTSPVLPHQLTVDLQDAYEIKGFVYTPRSDVNSNGSIGKFELYVADDIDNLGEPVVAGTFEKMREPNPIEFAEPKTGRFVVLKALASAQANQPWSSAIEFEILCDTATFRAKKITLADIRRALLLDEIGGGDPERVREFADLQWNIREKDRFDSTASETFLNDSLILDDDRDPLDIVLRRTAALLDDLMTISLDSYGVSYLDSATKLANLKAVADEIPVDQRKDRFEMFVKICELRREVMLSNPLLHFNEILFVKKHRGTYSHMCDQFYGVNLPPGGGLYVLRNPFGRDGQAPEVRNLLENSTVQNGRLLGQKLDEGSFLSPELSFDGRKIAFAYVECQGDTAHRYHTDPTRGHWHESRCFHIFTVNADGSDLRQITDGTWNDFDPCWLPNGRLAFITERRGGYLRCGRTCPTYTLFDMNPDGTGMRCLSYHETNEWHPSVTHDGRILYTRWDYPDRHGCAAHLPWITTLDGRDSRHVHGNFAPRHLRADMELDCRVIPNSPKFVATAAPHHGQAFGSLIIVDPQVEDDDAMAPVKRLTPEIAFPESQGGAQVYGNPWPLSEKYYLAVADFSVLPNQGMEGQPYFRGDYGIYLVDAFGNKELIYRDPEIASLSPIPFESRSTPPAPPQQIADTIEEQPYLAPTRDRNLPAATVSVMNVYQGLRPWPEGTKLKELRIIQLIPMSLPSGGPPHEIGFREPTSPDSVVLARYVLGTVPIEDDGSVHFTVPPRRELIFQVLDEDGLAVQSMRSSTYLHDGEILACNGCHEPKTSASLQPSTMPKALSRAPSAIQPSHPDAMPFSYPRLVQPVLDKHCVSCHADEIAHGTENVPNLAKDPIKNKWYASYNELVPKYGFYSYGEPLRTMPGKFGARASKLYEILKAGHHDVKLDAVELQRITLWLDCVSIFYGVYEKEGGEAQLRGEIVWPTLE